MKIINKKRFSLAVLILIILIILVIRGIGKIDKKEAKKMAADNLELFLSKLEEKGLQIIEKNVMMDKEKNSYIFQGTVLTKEKLESYRVTKQLEVPKEEGTVENESE